VSEREGESERERESESERESKREQERARDNEGMYHIMHIVTNSTQICALICSVYL